MHTIASALLETNAVIIKTNPDDFFTWTSGKRSPIYCDNRTLISYPDKRKEIVSAFVELIKKQYPDCELVAGTATAGIAWASWIADELDLPMCYIRSKAKEYGTKSAIEGSVKKGQKTLIIEDLISTGKSSLNAYDHCKTNELNVLGVVSIFSYELPESFEKFSSAEVRFDSLCTLTNLLDYSKETNAIKEEEAKLVKDALHS